MINNAYLSDKIPYLLANPCRCSGARAISNHAAAYPQTLIPKQGEGSTLAVVVRQSKNQTP